MLRGSQLLLMVMGGWRRRNGLNWDTAACWCNWFAASSLKKAPSSRKLCQVCPLPCPSNPKQCEGKGASFSSLPCSDFVNDGVIKTCGWPFVTSQRATRVILPAAIAFVFVSLQTSAKRGKMLFSGDLMEFVFFAYLALEATWRLLWRIWREKQD